MLRGAVLLLALALTGCGGSSWSQKADERKRASDIYVNKGVGYLEEGRYEQARVDLERALELNSNSSEAHNAMAVLAERLDKPEQARSHYKQAISLDERNYGAFNNYSRFLCSHGEYEEGEQLLEQVIDTHLYAQPWLVLANKGICYKSAGKLDEAERSLREAVELQPDFSPALLELARLSFDSKNFMKTRAFLLRYVVTAQHTAETLWMAAKTEEALGNQTGMRGYLAQLQERFPESPEAAAAKQAYPAPAR